MESWKAMGPETEVHLVLRSLPHHLLQRRPHVEAHRRGAFAPCRGDSSSLQGSLI